MQIQLHIQRFIQTSIHSTANILLLHVPNSQIVVAAVNDLKYHSEKSTNCFGRFSSELICKIHSAFLAQKQYSCHTSIEAAHGGYCIMFTGYKKRMWEGVTWVSERGYNCLNVRDNIKAAWRKKFCCIEENTLVVLAKCNLIQPYTTRNYLP